MRLFAKSNNKHKSRKPIDTTLLQIELTEIIKILEEEKRNDLYWRLVLSCVMLFYGAMLYDSMLKLGKTFAEEQFISNDTKSMMDLAHTSIMFSVLCVLSYKIFASHFQLPYGMVEDPHSLDTPTRYQLRSHYEKIRKFPYNSKSFDALRHKFIDFIKSEQLSDSIALLTACREQLQILQQAHSNQAIARYKQ